MKIKDRLPYGARHILGRSSRLLRYGALVLISGTGKGRHSCSVCGKEIRGFVHGGALCPFCTSFPRHRALLPLIERWVSTATDDVKLMHVAPDMRMRARLILSDRLTYLGVDRFTPGHYYPPDTIHGDIEALDLDSDSQDICICLHVLEHVENDRKALAEIYRVLKPGGIAILAFPFRKGEPTYEDPTIVEPEAREVAFGQWDHLRVFGEDVADRMSEAGLETVKFTPNDIWSEEAIIRWGLISEEVFFFCRKAGTASELSKATLS